MKKIFCCISFLALFSCVGYEPLFSAKDLSFFIEDIKNINDDKITKNLSRSLFNHKLKADGKKRYLLEISSDIKDIITSKDPTGRALTYEMIVNVKLKVLAHDTGLIINTFNINKNFNYNNQDNKVDFNRYKKNIQQIIVNKISQDIIIKLQSL